MAHSVTPPAKGAKGAKGYLAMTFRNGVPIDSFFLAPSKDKDHMPEACGLSLSHRSNDPTGESVCDRAFDACPGLALRNTRS